MCVCVCVCVCVLLSTLTVVSLSCVFSHLSRAAIELTTMQGNDPAYRTYLNARYVVFIIALLLCVTIVVLSATDAKSRIANEKKSEDSHEYLIGQ